MLYTTPTVLYMLDTIQLYATSNSSNAQSGPHRAAATDLVLLMPLCGSSESKYNPYDLRTVNSPCQTYGLLV